MPRLRMSVALASLLLVVTACGEEMGGDGGAATSTSVPETSASPPTDATATTSPSPTGGDGAAVVDQAVTDLAGRLGIDPEEIDVVSFEQVTWNDGSLGCPQPGEMYTQALVEGTLTVLSVDDEEYRYHSGRGDAPFLCEQDRVATSRPPDTAPES
jgi:hypothetical protein